MASKTDENLSLKETFDKSWALCKQIESDDRPSGCVEVQELINQAHLALISCTNMVNSLRLYSSNEELDEVSTDSLRYFLIPSFLGNLSLKQTQGDRLQNVENAKIYITDFLRRCSSYGLANKYVTDMLNQAEESAPTQKELSQLGSERQQKIERLKETKRLNQAIEDLEKRIKQSDEEVDDEVQREYFISWIQFWINQSIDNLIATKKELEILEYMKNMKLSNGSTTQQPAVKKKQPFKPVLITRDMIKNKVFGVGYPSLPTMSQEEYFEKEIAEGKIVLDYDASKSKSASRAEEEEEETGKKDDDSDDDDDEKLQKARAMDEFKDDHKAGEGNRYNRS